MKGFEFAIINPVDELVGGGELQGNAITFQEVAIFGFVHPKLTVVEVTELLVKP